MKLNVEPGSTVETSVVGTEAAADSTTMATDVGNVALEMMCHQRLAQSVHEKRREQQMVEDECLMTTKGQAMPSQTANLSAAVN